MSEGICDFPIIQQLFCFIIIFEAYLSLSKDITVFLSSYEACRVFFPKEPISIAASIILFPLMIDVVQIIIRFRAGTNLLVYRFEKKGMKHTCFLLRNKSQGRNFGECYATQEHHKHNLLLATASK